MYSKSIIFYATTKLNFFLRNCAKTRLRQCRISNMFGVAPPDPRFKWKRKNEQGRGRGRLWPPAQGHNLPLDPTGGKVPRPPLKTRASRSPWIRPLHLDQLSESDTELVFAAKKIIWSPTPNFMGNYWSPRVDFVVFRPVVFFRFSKKNLILRKLLL